MSRPYPEMPEWDAILAKEAFGLDRTALDQFIYDNTPAGSEAEFREELSAAINCAIDADRAAARMEGIVRMRAALTIVATMPLAAQDNMVAANMRKVAMTRDALESALREALAQDRADAERYRWLRDAGIGFDIGVREESDDGEDWVHGYPPDELDEAVDAAIAAERGE